jgi:hypothetical protein
MSSTFISFSPRRCHSWTLSSIQLLQVASNLVGIDIFLLSSAIQHISLGRHSSNRPRPNFLATPNDTHLHIRIYPDDFLSSLATSIPSFFLCIQCWTLVVHHYHLSSVFFSSPTTLALSFRRCRCRLLPLMGFLLFSLVSTLPSNREGLEQSRVPQIIIIVYLRLISWCLDLFRESKPRVESPVLGFVREVTCLSLGGDPL